MDGMNRRSFLKMLGLVVPVAAVAPTYFFAPRDGWDVTASGLSLPACNQFFTPDFISREALMILHNNLKFASGFNREF
jgi:hypothetical protein